MLAFHRPPRPEFLAPRDPRKRRADPWWAPKPPPLGKRGGLPVVVGVVDRVTSKGLIIVRAACPYCDRWHQHGHPGAPAADAGSRVADCGGGVYYVRVGWPPLRVLAREVKP